MAQVDAVGSCESPGRLAPPAGSEMLDERVGLRCEHNERHEAGNLESLGD
jgi:hypothetical protein